MKSYLSSSANVNGVWPFIAPKNSSGPSLTDGTPILADFSAPDWALTQALMDRVSMTASGTVELYTAVGSGSSSGVGQTISDPAQQRIAALARNFGHPGELVFDMITTAPTRRVIALQGQTVDGFLYPDLWYSTWCGSANNATANAFFTTSDAGGVTRAVTGLTVNGVTGGRYLVLPDARGLSPAGNGTNGNATWGKTANGTFYTASILTMYILDMMAGHLHQVYGYQNSAGSGSSANSVNAGTASGVYTGTPSTDGTNGTPRVGALTRTPSFVTNIGIRY